MIPGSFWAFCPQAKKEHLGDYHKVFNVSNFSKWFGDLLEKLKQPSLIIMDNAKYHTAYGDEIPKVSKMKKKELQKYLRKKKIPFDKKKDLVISLKEKARQHIKMNERKLVERMAEEKGHKVLFTPPYYSDLQPIEYVWAFVKGNVGRQYSINTSLQEVYERLENEFAKLSTKGDLIASMIKHCKRNASKLWSELEDEGESDTESKQKKKGKDGNEKKDTNHVDDDEEEDNSEWDSENESENNDEESDNDSSISEESCF